jgi:hypothetical protein
MSLQPDHVFNGYGGLMRLITNPLHHEISNLLKYLAGDVFGVSRGTMANSCGRYDPNDFFKPNAANNTNTKRVSDDKAKKSYLRHYLPFLSLFDSTTDISPTTQYSYVLTTIACFTICFWFCYPKTSPLHFDSLMSHILAIHLASLFIYGTAVFPLPDKIYNIAPKDIVEQSTRNTETNAALREKMCYIERYAGTIVKPRLQVIAKVIACRILENVMLVVVLPLSRAALQWSGYAKNVENNISLLSDTYVNQYYVYLLLVTTVITSCSVLFVQQIVYNRIYLAGVAAVTGSWERCFEETKETCDNWTVWDKKKVYQRGEKVWVQKSNGIYLCLAKNTIVHPCDIFLSGNHDLFSNDIGPTWSSNSIAVVAKLHFVHTFSIFILAACLCQTDAFGVLLVIAAANIVAGMGINRIGMEGRLTVREERRFVRETVAGYWQGK